MDMILTPHAKGYNLNVSKNRVESNMAVNIKIINAADTYTFIYVVISNEIDLTKNEKYILIAITKTSVVY
ncbi:hypothetical protein PGB90_009504 [Kerria lacca]